MTEEQQRKAIAEFCGVKPISDGYCCHEPQGNGIVLVTPTRRQCQEWLNALPASSPYKKHVVRELFHYPNYTQDLNAVREAEEHLVETGLHEQYVVYLGGICYESLPPHLRTAWHDNETFADWMLCRATAAQRAEAFLRTIGKWTE